MLQIKSVWRFRVKKITQYIQDNFELGNNFGILKNFISDVRFLDKIKILKTIFSFATAASHDDSRQNNARFKIPRL